MCIRDSFSHHLDESNGFHILLVEPSADTPEVEKANLASLKSQPRPSEATITIGPEGGWSRKELTQAQTSGCHLLTLGSRTLRADVIPITAVAVLLSIWNEL